MDIYQQLHEEHQNLRTLLDAVSAGEGDVGAAFKRLKALFELHDLFEREVLYPAIELNDDAEAAVDEAVEEHDGAISLIEDMSELEPGDARFGELAAALKTAVEQHIEEEESKLFAMAKRVIDAHAAQAMSEKYSAARSHMIGD